MIGLLWLGLVACLLTVTVVGLRGYGARRWATSMLALTRNLESARIGSRVRATTPLRFDSRELETLPAPVQRYFRTVLKEGQPFVSALTIDMTGIFNMSLTGQRWLPFKSRQRVITRRPGFLWDARIAMAPRLALHVVDSYIAGEGLLRAAMLGLFTMARVQGGAEIARGEFMRFFAESVWYPTELLPSQGVQWESVDEHSAYASMTDGPLTLTLLFRFNGANLIDTVRAEARGGMVGNRLVMMPWECTLSNYQVRDGITVPITGEAAWVRPEGRRPYFHGTITSLRFEYEPS